MEIIIITLLINLFCWTVFFISFGKDRSKYRNCYFLFIAMVSIMPVILAISEDYMVYVLLGTVISILVCLLIVPFFLIHNGIVMMKKEGKRISHLLSLILGTIVLIGELATFVNLFYVAFDPGMIEEEFYHTAIFYITAFISGTVIYSSISFVIFMIYTLFLQVVPKKKSFDYVIIHGAGLIGGDKVSKLLQDRIDKGVEIYRKSKPPTKLILSGGQGPDEKISEAEAMKRFLIDRGIPKKDIVLEDKSTTTLENLSNSKKIIDKNKDGKNIALVTSNYHVYRALRYAHKINLKCTGIGSHVAFYYWPSALIREYIAIHAELKHAVIFIIGWFVLVLFPFIVLLMNI